MRRGRPRKYTNHKRHDFENFEYIYRSLVTKMEYNRWKRKKSEKAAFTRFDNLTLGLYLIDRGIPLSSLHIGRLMQVSDRTVKDMWRWAWEHLNVVVMWHRKDNDINIGKYVIEDWGLLDREKVIEHVIDVYGMQRKDKILLAAQAKSKEGS